MDEQIFISADFPEAKAMEEEYENIWPRSLAQYRQLHGDTLYPIHLDDYGKEKNRRRIADWRTIARGKVPYYDSEWYSEEIFEEGAHYEGCDGRHAPGWRHLCKCKRDMMTEIDKKIVEGKRCYLFAWLDAVGHPYSPLSAQESELLDYLLTAERDLGKCDCPLRYEFDMMGHWRKMSCHENYEHSDELSFALAERLAEVGALDQLKRMMLPKLSQLSIDARVRIFGRTPQYELMVTAARRGQTAVVAWLLSKKPVSEEDEEREEESDASPQLRVGPTDLRPMTFADQEREGLTLNDLVRAFAHENDRLRTAQSRLGELY